MYYISVYIRIEYLYYIQGYIYLTTGFYTVTTVTTNNPIYHGHTIVAKRWKNWFKKR